ncbi:dirigent protein 21 [Brachypodium distachyon]|uniref:Dirigent protein n=1 Tax=Brachypodium distachyon TaxID=15368 RepID=I1IMK1_BRADI|nr:dirigent protein 21 [Brachypodium distachyon]KQJ88949.1 hypothetical protein BRADI_4g22240v3 [Brachypodium distachyon]|eukprot:XP_003576166.1 dirigent protein 21 [Brachypodium distachyon]
MANKLILILSAASLLLVSLELAGVAATTTHLRFYMHDIVTALPPLYPVATAVPTVKGVTLLPNDPINRFGDTYVIDDSLTEGPEADSRLVGRAQGYYMFASQTDPSLLLSANMVFTAAAGKQYNGSSVAVLARDAILDAVRELPVVGGTGVFRGARGYGLLRTHSFNLSSNNAVLQIDVYVQV